MNGIAGWEVKLGGEGVKPAKILHPFFLQLAPAIPSEAAGVRKEGDCVLPF